MACGSENDDMQFLLDHSHSEDLNIRTLARCVRTRLYFTSESHLYTLLNVLRYSGSPPDYKDSCLSEEGRRLLEETAELSYLTQITIRLFDIPSKELSDPSRFRCEVSFSPGSLDEESEVIPPPVVLNKHISCAAMLASLQSSIVAGKSQSSTPATGDFDWDRGSGLSVFTGDRGACTTALPTTPERAPAIYGAYYRYDVDLLTAGPL